MSGLPELPDVTQRFISDVTPYLAEMTRLIEATELATASVEALQRAIDGLDGKTVTIAVKTVGDAGGGLGGIAPQADAAAHAVHDLAVVWTEEEAAQAAADAGAAAFGRDAAAAAAATEDLRIRIEDAIAAQNAYEDDVLRALIANAEFDQSLINSGRSTAAYSDMLVRRLGPAALAVQRDVTQAGGAIDNTTRAVDNANRGWAVNIGWMRLTATALHWIVAGSAEFLAVAVPAAIALGAGLMVAAQGAQNAQAHFSALYAATESTFSAFHQTIGTTLGLGDALQKAQDAANPGVYELLGSAVNDAKSGFSSLAGVGLQVVHMFDEFAARVTVDLKSGMGTQIQGLLAGMVTDLQRFGNVLGNLGHALLNFAASMPGLAQWLLNIAVGISDVVEWASRGGVLLTFGMALEEVFRWGGLVLTMLVRLTGQMAVMNAMGATNFITRFGAALLTLGAGLAGALTRVGSFIAGLSILPGLTSRVGAGLQTMGAELEGVTQAMSPGMVAGIAAAIAAMIGLMLVMSHLKDTEQQLAANAVKAVQAASDAQFVNTAITQYGKLQASIQQVNTSFSHLSVNAREAGAAADSSMAQWNPFTAALGGAGRLLGGLGQGLSAASDQFARMPGPLNGAIGSILSFFGAFSQSAKANSDLTALHVAEMGIIGTTHTFGSNLSFLSGQFHTTAVGALALANAAGVNLTQGLLKGTEQGKIAIQMINNLKTGLGAMAAPAGVVGADMEAVGIQSQLAASKVQTVNQALDAFVGSTTGGMNGIMQFNAALRAMGKDTVSGSQNIAGAINTISASAAKMGYTLQGFGAHAQQSWQQFDAAVQQGNSVLDTFRTGMAEGVVSSGQYMNEIRAVGGSLLPFAANNKTALAIVSQLSQEMGNPATTSLKTLASQFGITGRAAQNMATVGMEQAVARMANMNVVARNLSVTVGSQLDAAMATAITKFSGVQSAANNYAKALSNASTPASTLAKDQAAFNTAMQNEGRMQSAAITDINKHAGALGGLGSAYKGANTSASDFAGSTKTASDAMQSVQQNAKTASLTTQGFGQQAQTAATQARGLGSNAQTATTQVKNLGTAASVTKGYVGDVNNEMRTAASAASGATGPLGSVTGSIRNVGSAAATAAGQVGALALAISHLQSKTITVTTNFVTNGTPRASGGPVAAGMPYTVGETGRELFIPSLSGMILPHDQTERVLSPVASPETAAAIGGGGGSGTATIHNHVYLDSQQIWENQQQATLRYNARNGNSGSGIVSPRSVAKG